MEHLRVSRISYAVLLQLLFIINGACGLGSMSTIAASYDGNGGAFICGIMQGDTQKIQCWNSSDTSIYQVLPNQSPFWGISGGKDFLCGLRQDTSRPFCWNTSNVGIPRRLQDQAFYDIVSGNAHVCSLANTSLFASGINGSSVRCWRSHSLQLEIPSNESFVSLASGSNFVCGLKSLDGSVDCWGSSFASIMPNASFSLIQAGGFHACGLTDTSNVQCWGDNTYNQLDAPDGKQFLSLALGERHSCGIEAFSRKVLCWGDSSSNRTRSPWSFTFYTIAAGDSFTCGILFSNFSTFCWGGLFGHGTHLPLLPMIPSSCTDLECGYGKYEVNTSFAGGSMCPSSSFHACIPCRIGCRTPFLQTGQCRSKHDITCVQYTEPSSAPSPISLSISRQMVTGGKKTKLSVGLIALFIFGVVGTLCGIVSIIWCLITKCRGSVAALTLNTPQGRVHNSTIGVVETVPVPPTTRTMKRQRSSTSSVRNRGDVTTGRAQAFTIADLDAATTGFSEDNKIGAGSFGIVYRGILSDGRIVAIKRGEREAMVNDRKMKEKESAFQSELEFLSRLHHKQLVSLVGYCDEEDERMLVYDYMPNGTLHDHLHGRGRFKGECGVLPWQMRIKIALEAARGVEYLHTYAVPPIIHRDIKSSNILLDERWNARVSDFGLSTHGPGENSHLSLMAAGTLGYMDPEYYRCQHLTIKSDVYSFGVVLLELLTGERAIHKQSHGPVNLVDYAVPKITENDMASLLDQRPGAPTDKELKALELIAHIGAKCVKLEGKERPTMTEIVSVLEEAMLYSSRGWSRSHSAGTSMFQSELISLDPPAVSSDLPATVIEETKIESSSSTINDADV